MNIYLQTLVMRRIFIFIIFFSVTNTVFASIKDFSGSPLHLKLSGDVPGFNLQFKNILSPSKIVKLQPNVNGRIGVELFLRGFIGVGYSFKTQQDPEQKVKKGDTGLDDWRFSLTYNKFHIFLNYQRYSGFYIENSHEVDSSWNSNSPFLHLPDLKLKNLAINFTYIHNPDRFSLVSALDQVVRQESSGGSWLYGSAFTETEFSNSTSILPDSFKNEFGSDRDLSLAKFQALNIKIGYGYTYIWNKNWFASGVIMLGGGVQKKYYKTLSFDKSDTTSGAGKSDVIAVFGYNGDTHSGGVSLLADATHFNTENIKVDSSIWSVKLFYGHRF